MVRFYLQLVMFILRWLMTSGAGSAVGSFTKNLNLINVLCTFQNPINYNPVRGRVPCSAKCSVDPACRSFFYNKDSMECYGVGTVYYSASGCNPDFGYNYYVDDDFVTSLEDIYCTIDTDCPAGNYQCSTENYCQCEPGYSLNPSSGICTNGCTVYGNTFSTYRNKDLNCGGTYFSNVTEQISLDNCFPEDCLSVSFNSEIDACKIRQCTPLDDPLVDYYMVHTFVRNCA